MTPLVNPEAVGNSAVSSSAPSVLLRELERASGFMSGAAWVFSSPSRDVAQPRARGAA